MGFYNILKIYVWCGLNFYFKNIFTNGKNNIPQKEAVVFLANHQNAFLDALLIATSNKRPIHYLTRADIFKNKFLKWLLSLINMMPIFRIRDGWTSLSKNDKVFENCYQILSEKKAILLFPEGNHSDKRQLRPLSRGFTRIIFGALNKYPSLKITVIPVGINYSVHNKFGSSAALYYGNPINANEFFDKEDLSRAANKLRNEVSDKMKLLITHIEDEDQYDETIEYLKNSNVSFLNPYTTNKLIAEGIDNNKIIIDKNERPYIWKLIYPIVLINSIIPWSIWKSVEKKIKDPVFISSMRLSLGISLFPFFYLIQTSIIYFFYDLKIAIIYLFLTLSGVFVLNEK